MTTAQAFEQFISNIRVDKADVISTRYKAITKKLNQHFRDSDSDTAYTLQVGSYGRYTGIKGISDLDMVYIMPDTLWETYKSDPAQLLGDVRDVVKERYSQTDICYDRLVVDVKFSDMMIEIQPVFQIEKDGEIVFKYPDTKSSSYKITMPKQEQAEMKQFKDAHGDAHRHLCKMMRAWKNTMGVGMGGLLIDTLTYNFLNSNEDYAGYTCSKYDELVVAFLHYLKDEPKDQEYYLALGSKQRVFVKHKFQSKAKKAWDLAKKAIEASSEKEKNEQWRRVFGRNFPKAPEVCLEKAYSATTITDAEQFIEDVYPVDIRESLRIDCLITANGYRSRWLREFLQEFKLIPTVRSLDFQIREISVKPPYEVRWKVKNVGDEAIRRDCLRGQIISSNKGPYVRHESSNFRGPHFVECYIIKNGIVVARDRVDVPIE